MTEIPDHLQTLDAKIHIGGPGVSVSVRAQGGALFLNIDPAEVIAKVNEAIHMAFIHYRECVTHAGVDFPTQRILEVSYRIAIYILHRKEADARSSSKSPELSLDPSDLRGATAKGICWIYCEYQYPEMYAAKVAALTEMTLDEFNQYEQKHRPLLVSMGLLD